MKNRFRLHVDPLTAVAIAYLLIVERSVWGLLSIAAAALHESGHLLAGCLLHACPASLTVGAFGARIGLEGRLLSYREEAIIAAARPRSQSDLGRRRSPSAASARRRRRAAAFFCCRFAGIGRRQSASHADL